MIKNEVALLIGSGPMPVGALHVLDREKLVRHPLYGPLRQFEFAFKMLGMMCMELGDRKRLTTLWDELTDAALIPRNPKQSTINMDVLVDQVFINHVNKFAPPLLKFGRDLDNHELFGWFVDLDELEDILLSDKAVSSFLINDDPNCPSFAHVFNYGDKLMLLRQSAAYDKVQGNVDLMDIGTGLHIWQVNDKMTVDLHDYFNKTCVETALDYNTLSAVEMRRYPVTMSNPAERRGDN